MNAAAVDLSVIIPVYNELQSLQPLYEALKAALEPLNKSYEVILVDDGSTDGSTAELVRIANLDSAFKVIVFRKNFGQTAAMMGGIEMASGGVFIPMDADLQNNPADIPKLLEKLDEGYDVVSGWRINRQDRAISRVLPSIVANWLISWSSGLLLHDYGCTLKAYRREVIQNVRLYGEMHRFVPIYATWQGAKVAEIPVSHSPRRHGNSKYGINRTFKVLLDLIVVNFIGKYFNKPIYLFGSFGFSFMLISLLSGCYAVFLKLFRGVSFISTPMPLLSVFAFMTGIMAILMGLLAEVMVRIYYESQNRSTFIIHKTYNFDSPAEGGS